MIWDDGAWSTADADWTDLAVPIDAYDLETFDAGFYSVGSTTEAVVLVPGDTVFPLTAVQPDGLADSTLVALDVDGGGIVVGGATDDDVGVIGTTSGLDGVSDPMSWRRTSVDIIVGAGSSTVHDVCRYGDAIAAVGEIDGQGFFLSSTDGGETWKDETHDYPWSVATPGPISPIKTCAFYAPDRVESFGDDGYLAFLLVND